MVLHYVMLAPIEKIRKLWGTIGGVFLGWMFGVINVIFAWVYETELSRFASKGSPVPGEPLSRMIMENPGNFIFASLILGGLLGQTLTGKWAKAVDGDATSKTD